MKIKLLQIFALVLFISPVYAVDNDIIFPVVQNWKQSEVKTFNSTTLYQPIDGAADLFLKYNFEEMISTEYTNDSNYITVEIYRHKTNIDAFGIYSQERPDRNIYFKIGVQGYKEDDYLNFLSGRYYVKMRVSRANSQGNYALNEIATELAAQFNNNAQFPALFSTFPTEGMVPFSEKYVNKDVLGYNFLHSCYQVDYSSGGRSSVLFILKGNDEQDALKMLQSYFKFLKQPSDDLQDGLYGVADRYNGQITILKSGKYLICAKGNNTMEEYINMLNGISEKITQLKE